MSYRADYDFLIHNLRYDISSYISNYTEKLSIGIIDDLQKYKVYYLNLFMEQIENYSMTDKALNLLTDEQLITILDRINAILNKQYTYEFN